MAQRRVKTLSGSDVKNVQFSSGDLQEGVLSSVEKIRAVIRRILEKSRTEIIVLVAPSADSVEDAGSPSSKKNARRRKKKSNGLGRSGRITLEAIRSLCSEVEKKERGTKICVYSIPTMKLLNCAEKFFPQGCSLKVNTIRVYGPPSESDYEGGSFPPVDVDGSIDPADVLSRRLYSATHFIPAKLPERAHFRVGTLSANPHYLQGETDAQVAAAFLTRTTRNFPVLVVTTTIRSDNRSFDPEALADFFRGYVDIWVLIGSETRAAFNAAMPEDRIIIPLHARLYPQYTHGSWPNSRYYAPLSPNKMLGTFRAIESDVSPFYTTVASDSRLVPLSLNPFIDAEHHVRDNASVDRLLEKVSLSRPYGQPVIVISSGDISAIDFIDLSTVKKVVGDRVEVYLIAQGNATERFSSFMPPGCGVYGEAIRIYPEFPEGHIVSSLCPLFEAKKYECKEITTRVIDTALSFVRSDRAPSSESSHDDTFRLGGRVQSLLPARALVRTDDGTIVSIDTEKIWPGVNSAGVLSIDQKVEGIFDKKTKQLDIADMVVLPTLDDYRPGDNVIARVDVIETDYIIVSLTPKHQALIPRDLITSNPMDTLSSFFDVGDVTLAHFDGIETNEFGDGDDVILLRIDDVDDRVLPRRAPSLTVGGPPWILPPPNLFEHFDDEEQYLADQYIAALQRESEARFHALTAESSSDISGGEEEQSPTYCTSSLPEHASVERSPVVSALDTARDAHSVEQHIPVVESARSEEDVNSTIVVSTSEEIGSVQAHEEVLADYRAEIAKLKRKIEKRIVRDEKVQKEYKLLKSRFQTQLKKADEIEKHYKPFADFSSEELFRCEVYISWLRRFNPADRMARPLANYTLDENFLTSVDALEGISRAKILEVVVEILTGVAVENPSRHVHVLRKSGAGGSGPRFRYQGWTAYRASMQEGTASARRIHYLTDGNAYVLLQVGVHDDGLF